MTDTMLGIDVSKKTLDANSARGQRKQSRTFANSAEGWQQMLTWLKAMGSKQAHVCMEATGHHSLGLALALHDAGHVVSVVNPAQIRDFARTKLGRNKTDKVDAALIREYAEMFMPEPWAPPSPAMRRLCRPKPQPASVRHLDRPADAHLQDRQCGAAVIALHAGAGSNALQPDRRGPRGAPQELWSTEAKTNRRGGHA